MHQRAVIKMLPHRIQIPFGGGEGTGFLHRCRVLLIAPPTPQEARICSTLFE